MGESDVVAGNMEQVGNRVLNRGEALQMPSRLEALHDPLSSSDWLVSILRPVVQSFMRSLLDTRHGLSLCCVVGSKLVGDHNTRHTALTLQELTDQAFAHPGIAADSVRQRLITPRSARIRIEIRFQSSGSTKLVIRSRRLGLRSAWHLRSEPLGLPWSPHQPSDL